MVSQQFMASILMPTLFIAGLIVFIFAGKFAAFINRFDPLKVGYGKNYFRIMGAAICLLAIIVWFVLYNMPPGGY